VTSATHEASVVTDASGTFTLHVLAGTFDLRVSRPPVAMASPGPDGGTATDGGGAGDGGDSSTLGDGAALGPECTSTSVAVAWM
jgi:hypothetical protein